MQCLVNSPSNTWKEISAELEEQESIGPGLKIRCQNHGDIIEINSPEEFRQKSPEGGCTKMCPGVLPRCDHVCSKICHIVDRDHVLYKCKEKCARRCPDSERHMCPHDCYVYPCPPCQITMQRTLPCGHAIELPCHIDVITYLCQEIVPKLLECNHTACLRCSTPVEGYQCVIKEKKKLECGHTKLLPCHVPITNYECVERVNKELDCGHTGVMKCIDDPSKFVCQLPSLRNLPCGHDQTAPCNYDIASIKCLTVLDVVKADCKHTVRNTFLIRS